MINEKRLRKTLTELIDIYSPSGKEEDAQYFLEHRLKKAGMAPLRLTVEEDRDNLIVMPESEEADIVFVGHVDTVVPVHLDTYRHETEGDTIYGLGSSDMKGGVAAMVEAFTAYRGKHGQIPPAALALVVGEESSGDGASALIAEYSFSWALVGEPTDLVPCFSHYGYLEMELGTSGRRVHASLAGSRTHAVKGMLRCLLKLTTFLDRKYPDIVYNIRDLNSTGAGFASPERCDTAVDMHLPPQFPVGELMNEIEELLDDSDEGDSESPEGRNNTDIEKELSFLTIRSGFTVPAKGEFPGILKAVCAESDIPWKPGVFISDSDAGILWGEGVRPVIFGPGKLEEAHTQEESVSFSSVLKAAAIYLKILEGLGL